MVGIAPEIKHSIEKMRAGNYKNAAACIFPVKVVRREGCPSASGSELMDETFDFAKKALVEECLEVNYVVLES